LQQGNPPDNSTSSTPYQQGVVYVVHDANTGQVVLPPMTGNGHVNVEDTKKTFIPQIILACFVFWLCGFLFGLIAFILARKSVIRPTAFIANPHSSLKKTAPYF